MPAYVSERRKLTDDEWAILELWKDVAPPEPAVLARKLKRTKISQSDMFKMLGITTDFMSYREFRNAFNKLCNEGLVSRKGVNYRKLKIKMDELAETIVGEED